MRATKDSGVDWLGEIPADWVMKPCWSYFRRVKQTGLAGEELLSVYRDHGVVPKASRDDNHNVESEDLSSYQLVRVGDMVMNKMKAWQGSIALSDFRGIVSPAYFVYRPTHEFSRKYFHYLMRSAPYIGEYNRISKGVRIGQWDLDPTCFRTTQLIVPPPEEQHAIADFLDRETAKIDKLIAKQEQLITTLGERREAVVLRGVTRGFRFDVSFRSCRSSWMFEIPQDWQESRTRFHCQVSTGSGDTQDSVDEGKYPFYVRSDTPLRSPRFEFDGDAVLTAGDGAGVGKVFHLASGKFMAHQRVYVMNNFKGVTPKFFFYFFSSTFARVALDGTAKSTVDSLRRPMLTNHSMFVPSISEQIEIVTILDTLVASIDALVVAAENVTKLLKERRGSLISAAVTGELEVAR